MVETIKRLYKWLLGYSGWLLGCFKWTPFEESFMSVAQTALDEFQHWVMNLLQCNATTKCNEMQQRNTMKCNAMQLNKCNATKHNEMQCNAAKQ